MKKIVLLILILSLGNVQSTNAQFFKKLKEKLNKPLIKTKKEKVEVSDVELPEQGVLQEDEALVKVAVKGLNAYYKKLSMQNLRQYITSNRWSIVKHKVTGFPLYQWAVGAVIQKNSDGNCMLHQFILRKDYLGNGNYGKPYFNGINRGSTRAPYGNYIQCEATPVKIK